MAHGLRRGEAVDAGVVHEDSTFIPAASSFILPDSPSLTGKNHA